MLNLSTILETSARQYPHKEAVVFRDRCTVPGIPSVYTIAGTPAHQFLGFPRENPAGIGMISSGHHDKSKHY